MAESTLMTEAEHHAMDLTAELWNVLNREVIANGLGSAGDRSELAAAIHVIQRMVLGQAAARAYPDRYRLLGGNPAGYAEAQSGKPPADTSWIEMTR